jgi:hypothetical protein
MRVTLGKPEIPNLIVIGLKNCMDSKPHIDLLPPWLSFWTVRSTLKNEIAQNDIGLISPVSWITGQAPNGGRASPPEIGPNRRQINSAILQWDGLVTKWNAYYPPAICAP